MDKFIEKIEKNKIAIIRTWISSPRVIKIIRTYSINEDLLVKRYSFGFLEHYLLVIKNEPMPEEYLLHRLKGNKYPAYPEFPVGGDFLCIYTLDEATGTVIFARCGTHSELF